MSTKKTTKPEASGKLQDKFSETIGIRLRELRLMRGATAANLAEKMGVNFSRVLSIETAGRDLRVGTVYSYCKSLDFELVDVFQDFPVCTELAIEKFVRQGGEPKVIHKGYDYDNENFLYMACRIIGLCRKYPELAAQGVKLIEEAAQTLAEDEEAPISRWFKNPNKAT